ncbi:hypothetical protein HaLaN_11954, partial [Haematococcus lacustris]
MRWEGEWMRWEGKWRRGKRWEEGGRRGGWGRESPALGIGGAGAMAALQQMQGARVAEGRQLHITLQAPRAVRAAAAAAMMSSSAAT